MELLENIGINKQNIELVEGKQLLYGLIYTFSPRKWGIFKTYIETHIKTGFIELSKSPANTLIFFDKKLNGNLHLCDNY